MKIKIDVTADDIVRGGRGSYTRCPIALACIRAIPLKMEETISVSDIGGIFVINISTGLRKTFQMPNECYSFMGRFDYYIPVKPFSFEIDDGT